MGDAIETLKNLKILYELSINELERIRCPLDIDGSHLENLYGAGKYLDGTPDYFRQFFRDSATSLFLMEVKEFLKDLLLFGVLTQGKKRDPFTTEEEGKIPHEYPGVVLNNKSTLYNAIDTTPLFIICWDYYMEQTGDFELARINKESIRRALTYIVNHTAGDVFWENPANSNARRFALKATYRRDGGVVGRKNKSLVYPASFGLVQAQAITALRKASRIARKIDIGFSSQTLFEMADRMLDALWREFWSERYGMFATTIDQKGKIFALYSDPLEMLFYLEKDDIPGEKLEKLWQLADLLRTPYGYITYREEKRRVREFMVDQIWPHEQAYIAYVGLKFGRLDIARNALKIVDAMINFEHKFSEYSVYDRRTNSITPKGCHLQLWSLAAIRGFWKMKENF